MQLLTHSFLPVDIHRAHPRPQNFPHLLSVRLWLGGIFPKALSTNLSEAGT